MVRKSANIYTFFFGYVSKIVFQTSLVSFIILFSTQKGFSQYYTFNDTLNCSGGTPTFIVDLSASPDSVWVSPPQTRDGSCCVPPDNNCVQFTVELSPDSDGLIFTIPGGCGASPSGSLFYQVDCGPQVSVGTPLCLNGTGPFVLTFCKPGNNANCYSIESIPKPAGGDDIITADGCQDTLSITGLDASSIVWTSIAPGAPGAYNSYLDCATGCSTVVATPQPGYPPSISFQACGQAVGVCSNLPFCDTMMITIVPTVFVNISPLNPTICFGSPGVTLTANPAGGAAPFTYLWNTGATTQSILAATPGQYWVQMTDATDCPAALDTITVTQFSNTITANAGPDVTVCQSPLPSINLNGAVVGTTTGIWTNGTGIFSPDNTSLSTVYTPSPAEIAAGFVQIYLATTNNLTCPGDVDTIQINLPSFSTNIDTVVNNISCFGLTNGSIDLVLTGGALPATFLWNTGPISEDISNLSANNYQVVITDANGCQSSLALPIVEPPLLSIVNSVYSIYPSGTNISCFGLSDGSVNITISGGVLPYSYSWSNGAISEDLNNVPAGSYTVTVTDANGCQVIQTYNLIQPTILSQNVTAFVYPSGNNISCFGLSDGSVNLTVGGGSPGYTYMWNNGALTQDLNNIPSGIYNVTTTDLNGCTINSSITLTQPAILTQNVTSFIYPSGDNISCFGLSDGSVNLTIGGGSPGYSFVWNTGTLTEDLNNVLAGSYTVTSTDINGCTITSSIILSQPAILTQNVSAFVYPSGNNISCFGLSDGSANLTIGGGSPGYSFAWNNGSVLEDLNNIPAGNYTVTTTDLNGCTINSSITLTQPPVLTQNVAAFIYPSGNNISCFGLSDGSVNLTVGGGSPGYSFAWNNGSVTEDLSSVAAGNYAVIITDLNGCTINSSITLTQPAILTQNVSAFVYPSGNNISCFGLSDGSVNLTIGGGSPGYSFVWNNGTLTEDLNNIPAGIYSVTTTDLNGCTINSSITLSQPAILTQNVSAFVYPSGNNISCFGLSDGSVNLTIGGGSPGYSFAWNNGSVLEDLNNIPAGNYTVTTTDLNGCTINSLITLTQPTILTQNVAAFIYPSGNNISCFGLSDGSVNLTIGGGSPGYSFVWNNGTLTEDLSSIAAGNYAVIITDLNGCTINSSITLTQPAILTQNVSAFVYPSGNNISCFGLSDGSVNLTIGGGSPGYSFVWNNGTLTEDLNNVPAGSYTVTSTDINGCTITSSIILSQPTILTQNVSAFVYSSGNNITCFGLSDGSVNLTVGGGSPGYTYSWTNGALTQDLNNVPAGNYNVTVTDLNGCTINAAITLTQPTILFQNSSAFVYPSGDNISCFGLSDGSVNLTVGGGSPGYTFAWNNGSLTEDLNNIPAGIYSVTATDINGCTITSSITLSQPSILTSAISAFVYPSGDNISCFGLSDGSINLTIGGGSPAYSFVWNNGSLLEDLTNVAAGTYNVTTTDINGCSVNSTITLDQPTQMSNTLTPSVYVGGYNVTGCNFDGTINLNVNGGSPVYDYSWSNGSNNQNISGLGEGFYDMSVIDINGCIITDTIFLDAANPFDTTATLSLYNGGWNISCFGMSDGGIDLTVNGGVFPLDFDWSTGATTEDLVNVPAGIYNLTITDANGCQDNMTFLLQEPPILQNTLTAFEYVGEWNVSCFGASDGSIDMTVGGGTGPYSILWNTGAITEDISGLPAGTYSVTFIDDNGCARPAEITLKEPPQLNAMIDILSDFFGLPVSCGGATDGEIKAIISGGTPGYSISWNTVPPQTTPFISNLGEGTYQLTVTDTNGCVTTSEVILVANPNPVANISGAMSICYGEEIILDSGTDPQNNCEWSFSTGQTNLNCGPTPMLFDYIGCIDAELTITTPEQCQTIIDLVEYICINPNPEASFITEDTYISNIPGNIHFWNSSIGADSYLWNFADGETSMDEDVNHFFPPDQAGVYQVTLIAFTDFGCLDTATISIEVVEELVMFVPNVFTPDGDKFNNTFLPVITAGYDPNSYTLLIFDRWGEIIFESNDTEVGWDGALHGNLCEDGVYVWKIHIVDIEHGMPLELVGHVTLLK